jgi:hypothetical protein
MAGGNVKRSTFLNVSGGRLVNKKHGLSFDFWEGRLLKIGRYIDSYEGRKIPRYRILMEDADGEVAVINFAAKTAFSDGFFSRITGVNINAPFTLFVTLGRNEVSSCCYIKQGGKLIPKNPNFPKVIFSGSNDGFSDRTKDRRERDKVIEEIFQSLEAQLGVWEIPNRGFSVGFEKRGTLQERPDGVKTQSEKPKIENHRRIEDDGPPF